MQSVDARLRPSVQIDSASVEAYYHKELADPSKRVSSLRFPR